MLSALVKLRAIAKERRKGRHERVLELARDPLIREHRIAVEAREDALKGLFKTALQAELEGREREAFATLTTILREREDALARVAFERLRAILATAKSVEDELSSGLGEAEARWKKGFAAAAAEAVARLKGHSSEREQLTARLTAALCKADERAAGLARALRREPVAALLADVIAAPPPAFDSEGFLRFWNDLAGRIQGPEATAQFLLACRAPWPSFAPAVAFFARVDEAASEEFLQSLKAGALDAVSAWRRLAIERSPVLPRLSARVQASESLLALLERVERGEAFSAASLSEEQRELLSSSGLSDRFRALEKERRKLDVALEAVDELARSGQLSRARAELSDLLTAWPNHFQVLERAREFSAKEAATAKALTEIHEALANPTAENLLAARRHLVAQKTARADLKDLGLLATEVERALQRIAAAPKPAEATPPERHLKFHAQGAIPVAPPSARQGAMGGGPVLAERPFILRVEEASDWLVHASDRLLLGAVSGGVADLPIQAAIGSRHAWIERIESRLRIAPLPGQPLSVNARPIEAPHWLEHGDRIRLGRSLELRFRQPIDGNATAVLQFEGDFSIHGCKRVILFAGAGRERAIVLGAAPKAHVELRSGQDRAEIFAREPGEGLFVRSPQGVSIDEAEPRPQVRLTALRTLRAAGATFYVEELR